MARVGPDKHGILIHASGFPGMGNSECPTVLLPDGGSIRSVLIGSFGHSWPYDPQGTGSFCKETPYGEWEVRASFDEQSAGEYYDAVVRYKTDVKCKEKTASQRFQFRDGAYHKVTTPKAAKKGAKKRK